MHTICIILSVKNRIMICGTQLVRTPVTTAVTGTPNFVEHPRPVYLYLIYLQLLRTISPVLHLILNQHFEP